MNRWIDFQTWSLWFALLRIIAKESKYRSEAEAEAATLVGGENQWPTANDAKE